MSQSHFNVEDSQLVADLHKLSKKSHKLVRSSTYAAPSDPSVTIRSWKMNEFKYYDVPSPFPTLARGLFTRELPSENESAETRYQIVARGYDKFFNIGEVPWTDWSCLSMHTGPKYTLSLKSNGCIIFIAPISPSKLIVTSKHSLGPMQGVPETHAEVGHRWLKTHLSSKGKTEEELAACLWEKKWTAIAEVGREQKLLRAALIALYPLFLTKLCDDSFEEHVLPYSAERSGLHLHGINETCKAFHTLPTGTVDKFAEQWGFLKTPTIVLNTVSEVKSLTDEIAETGKWNGEAVEGFVVRTHIVDPKPGATSRDKRPPYPPGSSFFFKVKFDEPYMIYRDWREVTKILLSIKGSLDSANLPKSKLKRKETQLYVKWVKKEIKANPSAFSEFSKGKGIIATRERFLKWMGTEQGTKDLDGEDKSQKQAKEFGKTIIVPVAIPGCGKTAVSVALAHLFNFGHTQSDDVHAKKAAPVFIKNVVDLLKNHDIVIADKNNHLRQHRGALREAVSGRVPPVRLLALHWDLDRPMATIHRICGDRIFARGDRHQTLRADTEAKSHEDIIWQFLRNTEELADNEVDASIEMDIEEDLERAVTRAVDGCVRELGLQKPSSKRIAEAVQLAKEYVPKTKKPEDKKAKKAQSSLRYFAILAEIDVEEAIATRMEAAEDVPENGRAFWSKLVSDKRVTDRPHVTIVHQKALPAAMDLWDRCVALHQMPKPPLFSFNLAHLVWNDRVMALTVEDFNLDTETDREADDGQQGPQFVSQLSEEVRNTLHITVGTANQDIPPVEAKALVQAWRRGTPGIGSLVLGGLSVKGRIKGLIS
ncbi:RNA ligase-domain-containing protein [Phlebopus sp. FC_14]|nr:RNA ligase-domain-containing protein [Phlebopus sp. FC_14]